MRTNDAEIRDEKFDELLGNAIAREKRAYQRSTYLTAIPVIVGLSLFSFFTFRVIKLRQQSYVLDQEIQNKTIELDKVQGRLKVTSDDLVDSQKRLDESRKGLEEIKKGGVDPKKQAAATLNAIDQRWVIVLGGDRELSAAKTRAESLRSRGYQPLICQREGLWRTLAVFSSQTEAAENFSAVTAGSEDKPYMRDLHLWCLNLSESGSGVCECQP